MLKLKVVGKNELIKHNLTNNIIFRLIREIPYLVNLHVSKKFIKIQVTLYFHNAAPSFDGPEVWEMLC